MAGLQPLKATYSETTRPILLFLTVREPAVQRIPMMISKALAAGCLIPMPLGQILTATGKTPGPTPALPSKTPTIPPGKPQGLLGRRLFITAAETAAGADTIGITIRPGTIHPQVQIIHPIILRQVI